MRPAWRYTIAALSSGWIAFAVFPWGLFLDRFEAAAFLVPPVIVWGRRALPVRSMGAFHALGFVAVLCATVLFWACITTSTVMHTQDRVAADIAAGGQGIGDTGDNAMMLMCGWLPGLLYGIPLLLIDWMLFPRPPEMLRDPEEVLCASCGYDLRASPERCPECRAV